MNKSIKILKKPLTLRALKRRADEGRIRVNIEVSLNNLLGLDVSGLNELADERILDLNTISGSLSDIIYNVVGHTKEDTFGYLSGSIIIQVNADVSDIIY